MLLPGEVSLTTCGIMEKSAEAIVSIGNEPYEMDTEVSPI
jgi:hypothetical protein